MSDSFEKYFTPSQFAKMYNINKKTLLYYDEISLFKPAIIKDNGYRLYSLHQGSLFEVILLLKQLGTPLKTIKNYLDNRSISNLDNLLNEQKSIIDNQITNLNRINEIIKVKLEIINNSNDIFIEKIEIQYMEQEYLFLTENLRHNDEITSLKIMCEHMAKSYQNNIYEGYGVGCIINISDILDGNCTKLSHFYTRSSKNNINKDFFIKPKGKYLVFYYKGHWENSYQAYDKILSYVKEHNIILKGFSYEEFLLDDVVFKDPNQYITKFMLHIS